MNSREQVRVWYDPFADTAGLLFGDQEPGLLRPGTVVADDLPGLDGVELAFDGSPPKLVRARVTGATLERGPAWRAALGDLLGADVVAEIRRASGVAARRSDHRLDQEVDDDLAATRLRAAERGRKLPEPQPVSSTGPQPQPGTTWTDPVAAAARRRELSTSTLWSLDIIAGGDRERPTWPQAVVEASEVLTDLAEEALAIDPAEWRDALRPVVSQLEVAGEDDAVSRWEDRLGEVEQLTRLLDETPIDAEPVAMGGEPVPVGPELVLRGVSEAGGSVHWDRDSGGVRLPLRAELETALRALAQTVTDGRDAMTVERAVLLARSRVTAPVGAPTSTAERVATLLLDERELGDESTPWDGRELRWEAWMPPVWAQLIDADGEVLHTSATSLAAFDDQFVLYTTLPARSAGDALALTCSPHRMAGVPVADRARVWWPLAPSEARRWAPDVTDDPADSPVTRPVDALLRDARRAYTAALHDQVGPPVGFARSPADTQRSRLDEGSLLFQLVRRLDAWRLP